MKNFLLFFFLSMTIASFANADGADDWQDVGFNTDILKQLNQCMGCDLRATNFYSCQPLRRQLEWCKLY